MPDHDAPPIDSIALTPDTSATDSVPHLEALPPSSSASVSEPTDKGLQSCLDLFFERHFASDFCSFDSRSDFESKCRQEAVLAACVIALCSRYLSLETAQTEFGLASPNDVFRLYMRRARNLVKMVSDDPSVTHIQANLVLALAELLSSSGSRHWLFTGTAIRMAEIMRLNKEFHQKHSYREQEIRRRTFWACLMFDRVLAYFLGKHRTVNEESVSISVPGTDLSMLYQEETRGVTLASLAAYARPSDLGLASYFIKTIILWSDLADFAAYSRRRLEKHPPTSPESLFFARSEAAREWRDSLPEGLRWSIRNYDTHCALGQKKLFLSMQFLLHGALSIAHQCYLPHPTLYTNLVDLVDAAGWSYLYRDEPLVSNCVSNALTIGEILDYLMDPEQANDLPALQTIWVAATTLTAANVYLWMQYAHDETFSTPEYQFKASRYFDLVRQLVSSWTGEWKVANHWLRALDVMRDLYKAAYLGDVNERFFTNHGIELNPEEQDELLDDFRPQPGDGYPTLIALPNLQASVKFATCDTSARSIDIPSIWLQLSGGWPFGFAGPECAVEPPGNIQLTNDELEIPPA
ncbi:unnamed protein product [Clonostachys rhizophaga]|uniref:Xylanolytic transcriptional activator regulatory domain-containing protein n=1 Tax=Clonostachys rhizophaga TaxID=160324 RepID=A0A9N9VR71_9HYPO|nr:unnamed protein product [Clonostachys rhizophaga]